MIVSKKSVRLAVERNRIKRVIREYLKGRHLLGPDQELSFWIKAGAGERTNAELFSELRSCWG